ncbi:MAG TPA: hypothetical protein VJT71_16290 [Pyrinomonadaceae bacterium]|nr:hypothetical protein [Pyrinomonadaceae bacterium]
MSDMPQGFYAEEFYIYPYGPAKDATFGYIYGLPGVESRDGVLQASLLTSPQGAVLSIQAIWSAPAEAVSAAETQILNRYPEASFPQLRIAELSDTTATLSVTGVDGVTADFGPNETSGSDSYRVVFNEKLKATEKLAVLSALRGQEGVLKLTYSGTLALQETAALEIAGDLAQEAKTLAPKKPEKKSGGIFGSKKDTDALQPPPDLAAAAKSVDQALSEGRLKITRNETPNVSAALRSKIETKLREVVAKLLLDKIVQMGSDIEYLSSFTVKQKTSESERVEFRISRTADLGQSFAGKDTSSLVTDAGVVLPERQS